MDRKEGQEAFRQKRRVHWRMLNDKNFVTVDPSQNPSWLHRMRVKDDQRHRAGGIVVPPQTRPSWLQDMLRRENDKDSPVVESSDDQGGQNDKDSPVVESSDDQGGQNDKDSPVVESSDDQGEVDTLTENEGAATASATEGDLLALEKVMEYSPEEYESAEVTEEPKIDLNLNEDDNLLSEIDIFKSVDVLAACSRGDFSCLSDSDYFSTEPEPDPLTASEDHTIGIPDSRILPEEISAATSSLMVQPTKSSGVRDYQAALYEIAKKKNIIACLPTGSGKTLIAIKLMNYFQHAVKLDGKRIVFLANTVPLLKQQAEVISKCTKYSVQIVHGGNKNQWKDWSSTCSTFEVFVMIPAIFMDLLDHAFLKFHDLALLVLDECHHALKANPMSVIMMRYREVNDTHQYKMPRVLGLSATIVKKNVDSCSVDLEIKEVEKKLCCTAITYEGYEKVMKYSTNAELLVHYYDPSPRVEWEGKNFLSVLSKLETTIEKQMTLMIENTSPTSTEGLMDMLDRIKKAQQVYREMKNSIQDIRTVFAEVGPYGAMISANIKYEYFKGVYSSYLPAHFKHYFLTGIRTVMFRIQQYFRGLNTADKFKFGCSSKTLRLMNLLGTFRNNEDDFCGIIFVTRRMEAHSLGSFLEDLAFECPDQWGFIRPAVILGTNQGQCETPNYRQTIRQQSDILKSFRYGQANLVIATSILQEGIDVQSCSFVIRFDKVDSYPSFIQSMGRARKTNSKYHILLSNDKDESARGNALIEKFKSLKVQIDDTLQGQMACIKQAISTVSKEVREVDHSTQQLLQLKISLCPGGQPDSPRVTLFNAIGLVNKYTSLLREANKQFPSSSDEAKIASSLIKKVGGIDGESDPENDTFFALVKLPKNSVVKGIVMGPTMTGRLNAKRAGFLEVCRKLYQAGALDENLNPLRPTTIT